ncbi:LOW QUALITY PROTEIN: somatostatin receptor type 2-like [Pollicipes pollicipes]|uniref:LOW QUALITY PROTEIN: somatostatin receptor type 2-like n=1 Tax=Pollicipes pollicipes TaxID=41117 RepID=UPI0018855AFB|nr:LOW QUALITY PROTEIN: somatostatin receptor type 2-like [Pollicipes pollicipes]
MASGNPYQNCTVLQLLDNDTVNCLQVAPSTDPYKVINAILYATVMMIGLSGNTLVIYVILRYSKMQTVTNFYIFNLAVADEIFLISIPFILTTMSLGHWPFGMVMCKIYWTITSINQFTSSLFLTVMSADRYLAVCHPISSTQWRTPLVSKIVCLTAWTASSLMVVPLFMYAAEYEGQCNIFWPEDIGGEKAFTLYTFVMSFAMPVILILVFYVLVIHKLRHVGPKNRSRERKKSHRKVTRLVLTVITVYFCCYLPFWVTQLSMTLSSEARVRHSPVMVCVILLVYTLTYFNSAVNPILYAFLSDNFKKSFVKACQCARLPDVNNALQAENSVFPRRHGRQVAFPCHAQLNPCSLAETSNGHLTLKVPAIG